MKKNKLRYLLNNQMPSVATRVESTWPTIVEVIGSTGNYDYIEFVAEYAPYNLADLENICRTAELYEMSSMIKVDFQNRAYVAQKAMASGFQAVLLADHKTPEEVKESIRVLKPDTPEARGRFGYPNSRWIGYQPHNPQMEYAEMVQDTVIALMIEKKEAMDYIEEICAVPGVDMVQFGPSDYSMSCGWNQSEHIEDCRAAERRMIAAALQNGVQPRCEINTADEAQYYINLGVKHFCLGDELRNNTVYWTNAGNALKEKVEKIK